MASEMMSVARMRERFLAGEEVSAIATAAGLPQFKVRICLGMQNMKPATERHRTDFWRVALNLVRQPSLDSINFGLDRLIREFILAAKVKPTREQAARWWTELLTDEDEGAAA